MVLHYISDLALIKSSYHADHVSKLTNEVEFKVFIVYDDSPERGRNKIK
jgi:hypothetical protein